MTSPRRLLPDGSLAEMGHLPTALIYGYNVYTTFKVPIDEVRLLAHLTRLRANADAMGIPWPQYMEKQMDTLRGGSSGGFIRRLTLLPHIAEFTDLLRGESLPEDASILLISDRPLPPSKENDAPDLRVQTVVYERPMPTLKHGSIADTLFHRRKAKAKGLDDVIWVNRLGHLGEATTANVFCIQGETLWTPDPERDGCLPGITRSWILKLVVESGIRVVEDPVHTSMIPIFSGIFLTNAVSGIRRVSEIDGQPIAWTQEARRIVEELGKNLP